MPNTRVAPVVEGENAIKDIIGSIEKTEVKTVD